MSLKGPNLFDLSGRVALVPGASGGIGSAVAQMLAECGADVVLGFGSNRTRAVEVETAAAAMGRRVRLDQIDTSSFDAVTAWVQNVIGEFGRIDIVANCVGSHGHFQPFIEQMPAQWTEFTAQHFLSGVNLAHAVLSHMVQRRSGRIIYLSSDGAKTGQAGAAVSNGGNAAIIGFAKSLAREISRHGVTVNAVCPGPTRTPVLEQMISGGDVGAKLAEGAAKAIPMKRVGEPHEVAAAFAFLASDAASFITGQALSVSGGLTMY
jgi:2-hydroxycyclohexanecarboxyl-CoA dehydrogenase